MTHIFFSITWLAYRTIVKKILGRTAKNFQLNVVVTPKTVIYGNSKATFCGEFFDY